jgi:hypothetical protein
MKKFDQTDIFVNSVKTHPKVSLFGYNGRIIIDNTGETALKLNDFLPAPPPPPPPTEAPPITTTNFFIYTIEYDIYPIDFSSLSGTAYVLLSAPPADYSGVTVVFRRDDTNAGVTCRFYDYASPLFPFWDIPIGGQLVFISDGADWILQ